MRFMNLPDKYCKKNSKFYILPIKYEKDLTFGVGASKGPEEILKASKHLEYYEDQFDCEPFEDGIFTEETLDISYLEPKKAMKNIELNVPKNKFSIGLGGDHSVTIGLVKGHEKYHSNFDVIIFDSHSDFFSSWNNSEFNHRCVSKNISSNHNVLLIGVRSMDIDEKILIDKDENTNMISPYNFSFDILTKKLSLLKDKVYVSIDVDVFDPSFIRNTGTPEPGGFSWNNIIKTLEIIFKNKKVIGTDIVEFAPKENFRAESYSLARLAYKLMALKKNQD